MGALADLLHSIFVLLSTGSYGLPAYEGIQRGSPFYTLLFLTMGCLSFVLHCEETGICAPLKPNVHARLTGVSDGLSVFLAGVMMLVVFEVRGELLGRIVAGAWACIAWLRAPGAVAFNVGVAFALSFAVLVFDVVRYRRKFTPAYFKRLGLIAGMAALGAALFSVLRALWLWHGVWHVYAAGSTYLLLLAQRHKRMLAARAPRDGATSGHSSAAGGSLTTPMKRRAGPGGGGATGGAGATAAALTSGGAGANGGGGGADGSGSSEAVPV